MHAFECMHSHHPYINNPVHVLTHSNSHICTFTFTHMHIHIHVHTRTFTYSLIHTHAYSHTHTHSFIHMHIQMLTRAHTFIHVQHCVQSHSHVKYLRDLDLLRLFHSICPPSYLPVFLHSFDLCLIVTFNESCSNMCTITSKRLCLCNAHQVTMTQEKDPRIHRPPSIRPFLF